MTETQVAQATRRAAEARASRTPAENALGDTLVAEVNAALALWVAT